MTYFKQANPGDQLYTSLNKKIWPVGPLYAHFDSILAAYHEVDAILKETKMFMYLPKIDRDQLNKWHVLEKSHKTTL